MIKKSKIRLITTYYKPLNRYIAGLGYKKDGKFFIRSDSKSNYDIWLDDGFASIRATAVSILVNDETAKAILYDWQEPEAIGPASCYVETMMRKE